jgi:hypothetical protein
MLTVPAKIGAITNGDGHMCMVMKAPANKGTRMNMLAQ